MRLLIARLNYSLSTWKYIDLTLIKFGVISKQSQQRRSPEMCGGGHSVTSKSQDMLTGHKQGAREDSSDRCPAPDGRPAGAQAHAALAQRPAPTRRPDLWAGANPPTWTEQIYSTNNEELNEEHRFDPFVVLTWHRPWRRP